MVCSECHFPIPLHYMCITMSIMTITKTIFSIMSLSLITFIIMSLSIMTFIIMSLSIMTFIIMSLSIATISMTKQLNVTLSKLASNSECNYAECQFWWLSHIIFLYWVSLGWVSSCPAKLNLSFFKFCNVSRNIGCLHK